MQLYIPDHPYRILIIGDYGYGNTTALLNKQPARYWWNIFLS